MNEKRNLVTPIFVALALIVGFYFGVRTSSQQKVDFNGISTNSNFNMLSELINYIDAEYVDSVSREQLMDRTIVHLLEELDPHSYYIRAEDYAQMNEPLEGNFDGIGIQFNIQNDTLVVIDPIVGGPSEKVGVKAGDRITKVNDSLIAGVGIENNTVLKLLKGPKGTKVDITVKRRGMDPIDFTITRDQIPIHSVNARYMINDEVGYVKVDRFGANTYDEFMSAMDFISGKNAKKVLIDLRGNGGGYMNAATDMLNAFFERGTLLVYTEGKSRPRQDVFSSDSKPRFIDMDVVVLMDESSASASEIFAGAIQDHDRGIVVGRRSFGKGLVQEQTEWPNGAATRLTIARYYTPSGRCIQKPYEDGVKSYNEEYFHRYTNGEMISKDSIEIVDSISYTTDGGRSVFGSGGIIPDVFVPIDTVGGSSYLNQLVYAGIEYDFAFDYADQNRKQLMAYGGPEGYQKKFSISQKILDDLIAFGEERGVPFDEAGFVRSKNTIERRLKAYIARNIFNDEGFYPIWNSDDKVIKAALEADIPKILKAEEVN
jgi:carboxyl-terminal processing protease